MIATVVQFVLYWSDDVFVVTGNGGIYLGVCRMREKNVEEKKFFLGCGSIPELIDKHAEAILWINEYYMSKAKECHLCDDDVEQCAMPKFWQTQEEFCKAKDYCVVVHKMIIADLARQLDELHHICLGEKGWNIILWYWISIYIEAFYDKYIRIKYAIVHYPALYMNESNVWYISRRDCLADNEVLQAQQYKDIYNFLYFDNTDVNIFKSQYRIIQDRIPEKSLTKESCGLRQNVVGKIKELAFQEDVTLYLNSGYLNLSRTTLEILSRGRIRRLSLPEEINPQNDISMNMREKLKRDVDYGDVFINLIYDCLWKHIPMAFVEDFQDHFAVHQKAGLKIPTKIIDSVSIFSCLQFKLFVADAVNHGSKLEIIQHGGNYCIEKYTGLWEFEFAYKFYTWGNGFIKNNKGNMQAMPMPKTLSIRKKRGKQKNILFVGYVNYPYVTRINRLYVMKMKEFYAREDVFFQSLDQNSRRLLRVRCYPDDPWWERKERLAQKFPWMQFDSNLIYYKSMTEAKLVVTNVISTTCVESISCDIPTIIFDSKDFFVPDENASAILEELRGVHVLVDDPKEAAELINQNGQFIESWWKEKRRRDVVKRFKEMYASRSRFSGLKWVKEMLKESKDI